MTADQRMEFLNMKIGDRQLVRRRMADVIAKRHAFLEKAMMEKLGKDVPNVFGEALIEALVERATERGFEFGEKVVRIDLGHKLAPQFAAGVLTFQPGTGLWPC